jgi:methylenetetrahydrofolate dehydrogenase (NADP+)/methenyltetrahydrofolate cyclohydrolase
MGERIDGKAISAKVKEEVAEEVAKRTAAGHRAPGLATVLVGEDPASQVYVRNKRRSAEKAGLVDFHHHLDDTVTEDALLALIEELNEDDAVDGILCQLPLPSGIDAQRVLQAIDPDKDVDGFHPENVARLSLGMQGFVPCTPMGCMRMLKEVDAQVEGAHAVVVGRSNIVGKPMAQLLLQQNATVTICHSRTKDLAGICSQADILVAAVGRLHMLGAEHVKEGAIVLDVGINRKEDGKLAGDVDYDAVVDKARAITPVPGGVGPMTIAMLLGNTLIAHARRLSITASSDGTGGAFL